MDPRLQTLFRADSHEIIPCLGQRGKKPYPVQRQDRAISRMGCIKPGRLCFQKIISSQNQNITAEYQDCNWLAQVSVEIADFLRMML